MSQEGQNQTEMSVNDVKTMVREAQDVTVGVVNQLLAAITALRKRVDELEAEKSQVKEVTKHDKLSKTGK